MGCTGDSYQNSQWESSRESHSSLIASDFKSISEAEKTLDYKTIAIYGQHLIDDTQKAMDDNNNFKVEPKLQEAQKEWNLCMQDYNAAGKLMIQAETDHSVISQYQSILKSGTQHGDRCISIYMAS